MTAGRARLAVVAVFGLALSASAGAQPAPSIPPAPTRWVEDHAGFISPATRLALDGRLERYQRATGHQVVVWIGKSLDGAAIEDWAVRTFAAWKLGRKGHDDGLALFVLADDRKLHIEVGYGFEGQVPDAVAARIIREVMTPKLKAGDPDGAIRAGVDAILTAIEGQPWTDSAAPGAGTSETEQAPASGTSLTPRRIIQLLAMLAMLIFFITNPRMALLFMASIGGRRGGGFGGGGFGGGGGGFSGGGGRSGGGGASGSW